MSKEYRERFIKFIGTVTEDKRIVSLYHAMHNWEFAGMKQNDVVLQGNDLAVKIAREINNNIYMGYFSETTTIQAASVLLKKARSINEDDFESILNDIISKEEKDIIDG